MDMLNRLWTYYYILYYFQMLLFLSMTYNGYHVIHNWLPHSGYHISFPRASLDIDASYGSEDSSANDISREPRSASDIGPFSDTSAELESSDFDSLVAKFNMVVRALVEAAKTVERRAGEEKSRWPCFCFSLKYLYAHMYCVCSRISTIFAYILRGCWQIGD